MAYEDAGDPDQALEQAAKIATDPDVLGVIVARLSGMSLGEFLHTRIFEPLGMVDTGFHCPDEKAHRLADAWAYQAGQPPQLFDPAEKSGTRRVPRFESGGGGTWAGNLSTMAMAWVFAHACSATARESH